MPYLDHPKAGKAAGYQNVSNKNDGFLPYLVRAVQELKEIIDRHFEKEALKDERITRLEQENKEMRGELKKIRKMLKSRREE